MAGTLRSLWSASTRLLAAVKACTPSATSSSHPLLQAEADLEKLSSMLGGILPLLGDAERREVRDRSVAHWLWELRSFAYDAEDSLDELELELLRHRVTQGAATIGTSNARKRKASDPISSSPLCDASIQCSMVHSVKRIVERLEEIEGDRRRLHLKDGDAGRRVAEPRVRPPAGSLVDESRVYGREDDRAKIVDLLLGDHDGVAEAVAVVSVVGMGGVGKTTLAQLVYRDGRVRQQFELRSWVSVSEGFDVIRLMRATVDSITREKCGLSELPPLQQALSEAVRAKRFLLILDDVWIEEKQVWNALRAPLAGAVKGSKIMITCRSDKVSVASGTESSYELGCLSDEDSWSLFCRHAFPNQDADDYPCLASVGMQIVRKCGGLPLAVKMLGGSLRFEGDEDRWRDILRSDLWDFTQANDDVLPVLRLSYHHLPPALKQCFTYCAVLPRDCDFAKDEVIWMWMAQGFIQPSESKSMEDVGRGYFDDLLHMSFFQHSLDDLVDDSGDKYFMMHDLIHNLAQSVAGKECSGIDAGKPLESLTSVRHSSFSCKDTALILQLDHTFNFEALRTVLLMGSFWLYYHLDFNVVNDLFLKLKFLRVLDISYFSLAELPESIGNLKHLRYLGLEGSGIKRLPESICGLHNLQTLEVQNCTHLRQLPTGIRNLVNIRHLSLHLDRDVFFRRRTIISRMPSGVGHLVKLQTLPVFVIEEKGGCAGIEELKDLNDLEGELCLFNLHKVVHGMHDTAVAILKNKIYLKKLHLQWGGKPKCKSVSASEQEGVLEILQPHVNIEELRISHYGGTSFPRWVGDPSFLKLKTVELCHCSNCKQLPHLGQLPSLQALYVDSLEKVHCVGHEVFGNTTHEGIFFPSLETLAFFSLPKLEKLFLMADRFEFPCLNQLIINDCPNLKSLSLHSMPAMKYLHISQCGKLTLPDCLNTCSHSGLQKKQHTYLHTLVLCDCPKLGFLENQQLPPTLQSLDVIGSPLLEQWCQRHLADLEHIPELKVEPPMPELTLRNIYTVEDAKAKNLRNAEGLEMLELQWDLDDRFLGHGNEEILDSLQPHTNIEKLVIDGYRGQKFASWVGDPSFSKLVTVTLTDCLNCECLPPLGKLPLLKDLCIYRMNNLEYVGHQIFGGIAGFLSLRTLEFHEMPKWKEWQGEEHDVFPQLCQLTIDNCPRLRCLFSGGVLSSPDVLSIGNLPKWEELKVAASLALPRLSKLTIARCPMLRGLEMALPMMTSLYNLTLEDFDDGQIFHQLRHLPHSLKNVEILHCNELAEFLPTLPASLHDLRLQGCKGMVSFDLSPCFNTICYLWIEGFPSLIHLPLNNLYVLKVLYICNCPELTSINCGGTSLPCPPGLHCLSSLQLFSVMNCPKLELSLVDEVPSKLQYANFRDCPSLTEWCQRDWSASAHICKVWVDGVEIFTDGETTGIADIDDAILNMDSNDLDGNLCQEWLF